MEENYIGQHLCPNCIWSDQCDGECSCEFYDDGKSVVSLSDARIEEFIENDRKSFMDEYWEYVNEYSDGN